MTRLLAPTLVAFVIGSVPAQAISEAVAIAARTGEVIGAAATCGVPDGELTAVGRKVITWAKNAAHDAAELRRAQSAHETAVSRGAARVRRAGESACAATLRSLRELEMLER